MKILLLNDMKEFEFDFKDILTFGRSEDNDLELSSPDVSRYHGDIRRNPQDRSQFIIVDNDSTNGIFVNDIKIGKSAIISVGDVIRLFDVNLKIVELEPKVAPKNNIQFAEVVADDEETREVHYTPQKEPVISVESDTNASEIGSLTDMLKNENIFKLKSININSENNEKENINGRKFHLSNRIFYLLVVLFVIIGLLAFMVLVMGDKSNDGKSTNKGKNSENPADSLYIIYTEEFITPENVFRKNIIIEKNSATYIIDDLSNQLCFGPEVKKLDETEAAKLRQAINESDFFSLKGNYIGMEHGNKRTTKELRVILGDKENYVKVINVNTPREFLDVESAINHYTESHNENHLTLSSEELKKLARGSFYNAEDLFANYEANWGNLKEAIVQYSIVLDYLQVFSPEPEMRKVANEKLQKATEIRANLLRILKSEYSTYMRKNDLVKARELAQQIMNLVDDGSQDYKNARDASIKIENELRSQHK